MATRLGFFRDLRSALGIIARLVAVMWLVALVDALIFGGALRGFGIEPRAVRGLPGIVLAPFLHNGFPHVLANTTGLCMLGGLVALRDEGHFWAVTAFGILIGGAGTWLLGRPAIHIGASGVIFSYFGYLLAVGWYERRMPPILLSVVVFLLWGGLLLGALPTVNAGISWEAHLFGFLGGVLSARWLARRRAFRTA